MFGNADIWLANYSNTIFVQFDGYIVLKDGSIIKQPILTKDECNYVRVKLGMKEIQ